MGDAFAYDRARVAEWRVSLRNYSEVADGQILTSTRSSEGAGFLVRLVVPNHLLRRAAERATPNRAATDTPTATSCRGLATCIGARA